MEELQEKKINLDLAAGGSFMDCSFTNAWKFID
jgi:hypothetical protein